MKQSRVLFLLLLYILICVRAYAQSNCTAGTIIVTKLSEQTYQFAFSNPSAVINNDYLWDFGDGYYSKDPNPIHDFGSEVCKTVMINFKVTLQVNSCLELVSNGNFEKYFSEYYLSSEICESNTGGLCSCTTTVCYGTCYPPLKQNFQNDFGFYTEHSYRYEWGRPNCDYNRPQFYNTFRVNKGSTVTTGDNDDKTDHTTNSLAGKYLIIDGVTNLPPSNADYTARTLSWVQRVTDLKPNTVYKFSCWLKNVTGVFSTTMPPDPTTNPAPFVDFGYLTGFDYTTPPQNFDTQYSFQSMFDVIPNFPNHPKATYGGVVATNYTSSGIPIDNNSWMEMVGTFKTSSETFVDLAIVAYSAVDFGNDLGIDDISLREDCPGGVCTLPPTAQVTIDVCPPCQNCEPVFLPTSNTDYILSAWVKEDRQDFTPTYTQAGIILSFSTNGSDQTIPQFYATGPIIDKWQRIEQKFRVPSGTTGVKITLKSTPNIDIYYDDIRIHPIDATMKAFVYDPESLRLLAELDENNYSTFYEYDQEGKIRRLKKETERGTMTVQESSEQLLIR